MTKYKTFILTLAFALNAQASAQDSIAAQSPKTPAITDEIITEGQRGRSNHPAMEAFFDGDFVTAEIKFEREFLRLKRRTTAIENAAFEASNGQIRSESLASGRSASSTSASNLGNNSSQSNNSFTPSTTGDVTNKNKSGIGILNDGKVTGHDFAFVKYMAGLSELQLGKYKEAEKSFKTSLFHNSKNYDARLRLGLLHLKNKRYDAAAKQLEKLDKMRRKCIKTSCEDHKFITNATVELADVITKTSNSQE